MNCSDEIIDLYERHAEDFNRDRRRALQEKVWLDRFISLVRPSGVVLDLGCGMAEPIARYLLDTGFGVVGVDSSPTLIELAKARFPDSEWIVADMRQLEMGRCFDGILAWDSFFHLRPSDQRDMFSRFASHAGPGAPLMFTSGPAHGESTGSYCGEPLYHGSLDPAEYESLMVTNGFRVLSYVANDPDCGDHTVWLGRYFGNESDSLAASSFGYEPH